MPVEKTAAGGLGGRGLAAAFSLLPWLARIRLAGRSENIRSSMSDSFCLIFSRRASRSSSASCSRRSSASCCSSSSTSSRNSSSLDGLSLPFCIWALLSLLYCSTLRRVASTSTSLARLKMIVSTSSK
uniref:Uncharacterized protein n=1 Tax=Ixodes ricinus TaxID=34613 RepID=A0A147BDN9_IXORI